MWKYAVAIWLSLIAFVVVGKYGGWFTDSGLIYAGHILDWGCLICILAVAGNLGSRLDSDQSNPLTVLAAKRKADFAYLLEQVKNRNVAAVAALMEAYEDDS